MKQKGYAVPRPLDELRRKWENWLGWDRRITDALLGLFLGWMLVLFLVAAFAALALAGRALQGGKGSLGTSALIFAILSSPFLIWNTVIRQTTLNFQKRGT